MLVRPHKRIALPTKSTHTNTHTHTLPFERAEQARGCQLSLVFANPVRAVHERITDLGVICDVREPDVMRIAPVPLYNTYTDVFRFVSLLRAALEDVASA